MLSAVGPSPAKVFEEMSAQQYYCALTHYCRDTLKTQYYRMKQTNLVFFFKVITSGYKT